MHKTNNELLKTISSVIQPIDENVLDLERAHAAMHDSLTKYHAHQMVGRGHLALGDHHEASKWFNRAATHHNKASTIAKNHGIDNPEFFKLSDRVKHLTYDQAKSDY